MARSSAWFQDWTDADIANIFACSKINHYKKDELVYSDRQTEELCFVVTGAIWCCLRSEDNATKFGIAFPATLIGLSRLIGTAFHDEPCYEFYAKDESLAVTIPAHAYSSQLAMKPHLWRTTAHAAILYQRHCIKLSLVLYTGSVKNRIISATYQFGMSASLHKRNPPLHEFKISQDELGVLVQSSRQHVNRALQELESEGLIEVNYKRIKILNPDELERLAVSRIMQSPLPDSQAGA